MGLSCSQGQIISSLLGCLKHSSVSWMSELVTVCTFSSGDQHQKDCSREATNSRKINYSKNHILEVRKVLKEGYKFHPAQVKLTGFCSCLFRNFLCLDRSFYPLKTLGRLLHSLESSSLQFISIRPIQE